MSLSQGTSIGVWRCIEEEEQDASTQFWQTQKKQFTDLQDPIEKYCNVFPVFGFNSWVQE